MPRLAIVISAVGTAESLEATLLTVLENRPVDCEVVAVTNFPYADPYQLAGEVRFVAEAAEADAVACAAAAIPLVRSPVVHVIAAGCEVTEGWADRALEHFADLSVAAVAPLVLRADCRDQVLVAGIDYLAGGARRLRCAELARIEATGSAVVFGACSQAAFFRRSALEAVGGWATRLGSELADVEMAWALHRAGYRTLAEPAARIYSGPLAPVRLSAFRQGLYAERQFLRNASTVGWVSALLAHAWLVGWETLTHAASPSGLARLAGRACGAIDVRHWLSQAPRRPESAAAPADAHQQGSEQAPQSIRLAGTEHLRIDQGRPTRPKTGGRGSARHMRSA